MRVLLVEDEAPLRETLAARLKRDGFAVDTAADGEEGLYLGREVPFDIAIIDLGLPKISGMELVKELRDAGQRYPILILTARIELAGQGAGPEARRRRLSGQTLSRRGTARAHQRAGAPRQRLDQADARMRADRARHHRADRHVDGQPADLTSYEYKVLEYLMLHAGELVSKADLTEHIYQQDFDRDSNVLEVFIGRLRRKLDPDNALKPIETVRGRGYRFAIPRSDTHDEPAAEASSETAAK